MGSAASKVGRSGVEVSSQQVDATVVAVPVHDALTDCSTNQTTVLKQTVIRNDAEGVAVASDGGVKGWSMKDRREWLSTASSKTQLKPEPWRLTAQH